MRSTFTIFAIQEKRQKMSELKFQSLASGSSGNCYYVGNSSHGILIDAGISARKIRKRLRDIGVEFEQIWGLFITHDHADHISAVGALGERFNIPVYATQKVHDGINVNYAVTRKLTSASRRYHEKYETIAVGEFLITAFPVSHDSTDSVGFTVEYQGKRITLVTDLGIVCENVAEHIAQADYLVLEANYDEEMLLNGSYPYYLKQRVKADTGHLSNEQAGISIAEHYHERMQQVFLCHLSQENNTPELAYKTIKQHLENKQIIVGKDLELTVLKRHYPSELYVFAPSNSQPLSPSGLSPQGKEEGKKNFRGELGGCKK